MKEYIIPICTTVFNFLVLGLITWFFKVKAKSDKSDVEKIVKNELKGPLEKIEELEAGVDFLKEAIQDIHTYNKLSAEKSKNTRLNIQETLERQDKAFDSFMDEQRLHNTTVLNKIGEIVTSQAVMDVKKKDK